MTYIFNYMTAKSFTEFIKTESKAENLQKVDLYWHKQKGLNAIAKCQNGDEFVFSFINMNIQCARNLKNRLFNTLCSINENFMVQLKTY